MEKIKAIIKAKKLKITISGAGTMNQVAGPAHKACSFADAEGNSIGTIQGPEGDLPAIAERFFNDLQKRKKKTKSK
jgi:hypothetical protein